MISTLFGNLFQSSNLARLITIWTSEAVELQFRPTDWSQIVQGLWIYIDKVLGRSESGHITIENVQGHMSKSLSAY